MFGKQHDSGPPFCLTCDDVSRQGHIGYGLTSPLHQRIIGITGVAPLHAMEGAAAPTLSRHVQVVAHIWVGSYDLEAAMFEEGNGSFDVDATVWVTRADRFWQL